jgi:flagella basal body P-ring formation protein FlgA
MKILALAAFLLIAAPVLAQSAGTLNTAPARAYASDTAPARAYAGGVRIVVPAHDIARGETIAESDLSYVQVDGSTLMSGVVTSMAALTGMQTRRLLRAGEGLRADDVRHPIVVVKGQTVTMIFTAPGVELTAMGRAMSEGGVGDTVTVQNPASFRMISVIVTGPGTVRAVDPASASIALATARK